LIWDPVGLVFHGGHASISLALAGICQTNNSCFWTLLSSILIELLKNEAGYKADVQNIVGLDRYSSKVKERSEVLTHFYIKSGIYKDNR